MAVGVGLRWGRLSPLAHLVPPPTTINHIQIRRLPKPVIAAVAGYAVGGGHILHMMCDLTIAADNAVFGQTGPKVGSFDAGYGSTQVGVGLWAGAGAHGWADEADGPEAGKAVALHRRGRPPADACLQLPLLLQRADGTAGGPEAGEGDVVPSAPVRRTAGPGHGAGQHCGAPGPAGGRDAGLVRCGGLL